MKYQRSPVQIFDKAFYWPIFHYLCSAMETRTLYLLGAFILLGVVIALLRRLTLPRKTRESAPVHPAAKAVEQSVATSPQNGKAQEERERPRPEGCCGQHAVCEKETLLTTRPDVEYFDDEELDAFAGRCDDYSADEAAQFEEVLLTLRENEVADWLKSLQLRGITPPESVRDEALMIVSERRQA